MKKIPEAKKKVVDEFAEALASSKVIAVVNMENLPAAQLQTMAKILRKDVQIKMTKKRLLNLALEKAVKTRQDLGKIKDYFIGMPALIFTSQDPFKLYRKTQQSKAKAPAKPGQISPMDIEIKAGPTPFVPGPIISELAQLGLKTKVEEGKITIVQDKILVKQGEKINEKQASLLQRLDIKPMEIGLNIVAAFEDGMIYTKEVMALDDKKLMEDIAAAFTETCNLMAEICYITRENIEMFLSKAAAEARAVASEAGIITSETIPELLAKAEAEAKAVKDEVGLGNSN